MALLTALTTLAGCSHMLPGGVDTLAPVTRQSAIRTLAASRLEAQFGGVSSSASVQARLNRVGARVVEAARDCPIQCYFRVLRSAKPNAFSVPEGGIYVTAGLYNQLASDDLLAAALAHEVAHVAAGDGRRRSRSRADQLHKEMSADQRAVGYLMDAGHNPQALIELMEIIRHEQYPGWAAARIEAINRRFGPASQVSWTDYQTTEKPNP